VNEALKVKEIKHAIMQARDDAKKEAEQNKGIFNIFG